MTSMRAEDNIIRRGNGRFRVKAQTEIADFNEQFGTRFRATMNSTPSAGSCSRRSADCPNAAKRRRSTSFRFRVIRADSRRMYTLQVEKLAAAAGRATRRHRGGALIAWRPGRRRWLLGSRRSVFGFAPFGAWGVSLVALAALFALWQRAATPRAAARLGFASALGLFGAGASWVYVALNAFGGMPIRSLAAIGTALSARISRCFRRWPAGLWRAYAPADSCGAARGCRGAWTLAEWLRSTGYTGLSVACALGYAQVRASPLAGFAPLGGVLLVTLAVAAARGAAGAGDDGASRAGATLLRPPVLFAIAAIARRRSRSRRRRMDRTERRAGHRQRWCRAISRRS